MDNTLGYRIKKNRITNNLTQPELAKLLNVSNGIISIWENNVNEPKAHYLKELSIILNVTVDYLLGLENEDYTKTYDYSIEKIKSDLASDNNTSAKLDMKNKIENIARDKKINLEQLSNLSTEQINLIIQLAKTFNKN